MQDTSYGFSLSQHTPAIPETSMQESKSLPGVVEYFELKFAENVSNGNAAGSSNNKSDDESPPWNSGSSAGSDAEEEIDDLMKGKGWL